MHIHICIYIYIYRQIGSTEIPGGLGLTRASAAAPAG